MSTESLTRPAIDPESDPRIRTQLETGQISYADAEIKFTGVMPETQLTIDDIDVDQPRPDTIGAAVKREKSRRTPALPGLEAGAVSGRDAGRLIANEAAKNAEKVVLTKEGIDAREEAKRIAAAAAHKSFVMRPGFLEQSAAAQMAQLKAREELRKRRTTK